MGKTAKTDEMILAALQAYGMEDAGYELIRQNENITCRVDRNGTLYALRIHSPAEGFRTSIAAGGESDAELFRSEAELLLYMGRNGLEGLQEPVPNLAGEYVTEMENGVPAMLLSWVDGRPLTGEEGKTYAEEIGSLACRIHRAAGDFTGKRLHYDNALSDRMIGEIRRAVSLQHISEDAGRICIRELEAVKALQTRLETRTAPTVIHADLGLDNILITDRGLIPIDFSLSGYASLAQEAGMLLSNYQEKGTIASLLNGFAKSGEQVDAAEAEVFLSYSVLLFICSQQDRFFHEEWFGDAMKRWCTTLFVH